MIMDVLRRFEHFSNTNLSTFIICKNGLRVPIIKNTKSIIIDIIYTFVQITLRIIIPSKKYE